MTLGKIFYYILIIPTLLAKGVYYVKVQSNNSVEVIKVIKQ